MVCVAAVPAGAAFGCVRSNPLPCKSGRYASRSLPSPPAQHHDQSAVAITNPTAGQFAQPDAQRFLDRDSEESAPQHAVR